MAKGPIEQSLDGVDDPKTRAGIKAQAILDRLAALPANQRATYQLNGYTVQLLTVPVLLRDSEGRAVGITVRARAIDANGQLLPSDDFTHNVVNPPVSVRDGKTDADGNPTFVENPIATLKAWLLDSIIASAVRQGYVPL